MSRPQFSPEAKRDLQEISGVIRRDSPSAARRVVRSLREACTKLIAKHPEIGERCEELGRMLRRFVVGSYVIYYRNTSPVQVVRILHGARDAEELFRRS